MLTALVVILAALAIIAVVVVVVVRARQRAQQAPLPASEAQPLVPPPKAEVTNVGSITQPAVEVESDEEPGEAIVEQGEAPLSAPAPPAPTVEARLGKSRGLFASLRGFRRRSKIDEATWNDLEETLLRADVGVATTEVIIEDLRRVVAEGALDGSDDLLGALRTELIAKLDEVSGSRTLSVTTNDALVSVWLFVGVNGVGKTTTVGKLAAQRATAGAKVLLAAGDTFRAAAGEQLDQWATRSGVEIVRGESGGDPSAIVFDAVQRAKARNYDLVLADTAGRLHTKVNLVEELKKIRRVAAREPGDVTEVLLVIDATTGQNALVQARQFTEAVDVTGIVLTKLDGTARGGVVLAIQHELGIPVKLIGIGEQLGDLVAFDATEFVDALLAD